MMLDNNWYGHRTILSDFCNLDNKPSFSIIQHGWSAYYNAGYFGGKKKFRPPNICWSDIVKDKCKERGIKNIHSIGSPFLYLCKMLETSKDNLENQTATGAIYFPAHNTVQIKDSKTKHEKIINEIEKNCKAPFTVCFYYADLTDENTRIYKERNWRITCCGNRGDDKMLYKIYLELSKHEKIIVSEIGSLTFYAMYLKKKVKLLKSVNNELLMTRSSKIEESDDNIQNESLKNVDKRGYLERYDKCLRIGDEYEAKFINTFPSVVSDFLDEKSGFEIAKKELGFDSLKSVEELKKILGWSSYVKIFLSKIFSKYFDLRYKPQVRSGESEVPRHKIKLGESD